MEALSKISKFEDNILACEIYDNAENLPHNEQIVQCYKNDLENYGKEHHYVKVNDNKDSLPENVEESTIQRKSACNIIKDSRIKYSDCGEALQPQHIKIDFTSVPGVDDEAFLQQKCIDFWEFVNKHPKLKSIEIRKAHQNFSNESVIDKISVVQGCSQEIDIPAVTALRRPDIQQEANAFATKLKYTFCDHSDNDYVLGKTKVEQRQVELKKRASCHESQHNLGLKPRQVNVKDRTSIIKSRGVDEVKELCHRMDEWDLSHPRSMEPPKLAPSLKDLK